MANFQLVQTELFSGNGNKTVVIDEVDWTEFMNKVQRFILMNERLNPIQFAIRPELQYDKTQNLTNLNRLYIWGVLVRDAAGQVTQHNGYCELATQIVNDIPCFDYAIVGNNL